MGVARPELCPIFATVLQSLGVRRGMVVSGRVGDAWLGMIGVHASGDIFTIAEFYQDHASANSVLSPANFLLQPATLADLAGSDREANAAIIRRLLRNEDCGPKRDAVLL